MIEQQPNHSEQSLDIIKLSHREERELFNRQWSQEKDQRHHENMALADNVIFHGTFYRGGVGQRG